MARIRLLSKLAYARLLPMQDTNSAIVRSVRLHLAAKRRTQVWLAEQLGVSQFWIGRRMTGSTIFNVEEVDRIATAFGTTFEQLLADAEAVAA